MWNVVLVCSSLFTVAIESLEKQLTDRTIEAVLLASSGSTMTQKAHSPSHSASFSSQSSTAPPTSRHLPLVTPSATLAPSSMLATANGWLELFITQLLVSMTLGRLVNHLPTLVRVWCVYFFFLFCFLTIGISASVLSQSFHKLVRTCSTPASKFFNESVYQPQSVPFPTRLSIAPIDTNDENYKLQDFLVAGASTIPPPSQEHIQQKQQQNHKGRGKSDYGNVVVTNEQSTSISGLHSTSPSSFTSPCNILKATTATELSFGRQEQRRRSQSSHDHVRSLPTQAQLHHELLHSSLTAEGKMRISL